MNGIWRVTARLFGAPFTRRALAGPAVLRDRRDHRRARVRRGRGHAGSGARHLRLDRRHGRRPAAGRRRAQHRPLARRGCTAGCCGSATGELVTAPAPSGPAPALLGRLDRRLRDRDGWRAVGYTGVKLPVAIAEGYAVAATAIGLVDCRYPLVVAAVPQPPGRDEDRPLKAVAPDLPRAALGDRDLARHPEHGPGRRGVRGRRRVAGAGDHHRRRAGWCAPCSDRAGSASWSGPGRSRSRTRRRRCAGSSATCTTAPRSGSRPSR